MTSQTRNSYPQPSGNPSESTNDTELLPGYFGLNYAQQAALLWANAAAVAAAASSSSTSTGVSPQDSMLSQKTTNSTGSSSTMNTFDPKQSATQSKSNQRNASNKEAQIDKCETSTTYNPTSQIDPTTMLLAGSFNRQSADNRTKEKNFNSATPNNSDTQAFTKKPGVKDDHWLADTSKRTEGASGGGCSTPEAMLANQMLQSLAGAQMTYQRQVKQQQQQQQQQEQQQQASMALAAVLSREAGLSGFPPGYLESFLASGSMHTGSAMDETNRADSVNAATNLAYMRAMMMAIAAACGGMKNAVDSGGLAGSPGMPPIPLPPILPGGMSYEMPPLGHFGSTGNGSHQSTVISSPSSAAPTESFNDVLSFLSHCLNTSKPSTDRAMSHSVPVQRRPGRAGSNSRSRGGSMSGSNQNATWEQPVNPSPTRHRGRGRPPKSTTGAVHYQNTPKQPSSMPTSSTSYKRQEEHDFYQPISSESTSIGYGRRPSSTTSTSECSVEDTIDEVLRYLAACDHDPAVVASRYASSALGIALNRKRRKEACNPTATSSTHINLPATPTGYRGEPGELYMHSGNKRVRTSTSADSNLRRPLALGWRRETLVKGIGPGGILGEVIYVTPCGKRLWNMDSIREYLKSNNGTKLSIDDFSFKSYVRLGDYFECSRTGQSPQSYVKMSDAALDALITTAACTELPDSKHMPSNTSWPGTSLTDHVEGTQNIPGDLGVHGSLGTPSSNCTSQALHPSILPPVAHMNSTVTSKQLFNFPPNMYDTPNSDFNYTAYLSSSLNEESLSIPPVAHAANESTTINPTAIPFLDPYSSHSGLNSFGAPLRHPLVAGSTSTVNSPWSPLTRPTGFLPLNPCLPGVPSLTGLEPTLERDFMKQFFVHLAEEQLRLNEEKRAYKHKALLEQREQLLAMKVKERMEYELKKPVDDLRLLNLKPLPKLEPIEGNRLSSRVFSECLLVVEFLHAFTEILCVDSETIPTMGMLQAALVDRDPACQQAVLHLLIELLKFAILDPGLPSSRLVTQLLGQRFSELEVNPSTVTGLLRVFLIGRNGYEDDMSDWLRPPCHFTELSGDQQSALLAFVCDELVCSSRLISTEVDRTIELQAALRREKWVLESKIRRLRFVMVRKFGVTGPNENISSDQMLNNTGSLKGSSAGTSMMESSNDLGGAGIASVEPSRSPGPVVEDKESEHIESSLRSTDKFRSNSTKAEESKSIFYFDDTPETSSTGPHELSDKPTSNPTTIAGEAAQNASATATAAVSAATIANAFLSGDEEEVEDVNQLEAKIESLIRVVEHKQRAIDECSFRLSGIYLGQDRFFRRYYILGHSGGIYVQGDADVSTELPTYEDERTLADQRTTFTKIDNSETVDGVDLHFGFDPDQLVAEIESRRQLAEKRRYTIIIPTGHGMTHHQHTHPQGSASSNQPATNDTKAIVSQMDGSSETQDNHEHKDDQSAAKELGIVNSNPAKTAELDTEKPTEACHQRPLAESDSSVPKISTVADNCNEPRHTADSSLDSDTLGEKMPVLESNKEAGLSTSTYNCIESVTTDVYLNGAHSKDEVTMTDKDSTLFSSQERVQNGFLDSEDNSDKITEETNPCFGDNSNVSKTENETHTSSPLKPVMDNSDVQLSGCGIPPPEQRELKCEKTENRCKLEQAESKDSDRHITGDTEGKIINRLTNNDLLPVSTEQNFEKRSNNHINLEGDYNSVTDPHPNSAPDVTEDILIQSCSEITENCLNLSLSPNRMENADEPITTTAVNCETSVSAQPLDLSTKSTAKFQFGNSSQNTSALSVDHSSDNIYELMTNLGLDDVVLTTAALLFMTHTSIIPASVACNETLYEPWKSIIAHYKSILIWALMEEIKTDDQAEIPKPKHLDSSGSDRTPPQSLREAVLVLKKSFMDTVNTSDVTDSLRPTNSLKHNQREQHISKLSSTEEDMELDVTVSDSEVEQVAEQGLLTRNIQLTSTSGAKRINTVSTEWCRLTNLDKLRTLIQSLATRGVRERNLAKGIKQAEEVVENSLQVAANLNDELNYTKTGSDVELDPRFLRVRSRRGKGRGNPGTNAQFSTSSSASSLNPPTSARLGFNPAYSEASLPIPMSQTSSYQPLEQGFDSALPGTSNDPSDSAEESNHSTGTGDHPGTQTSSSIILEHRLRRRVSQKSTASNDGTGTLLKSVVARLEKRPGLKTSEAHANGRSLVELVGSEDPVFVGECCFLEEVESLEDRVLAASLQVKGWQAPVKVLEDETVHLIPRSTPKRSRFEQWPLDLARTRLLSLEYHLERRYLLPPLNSEVHLDVVPESDSILSNDIHRSFSEAADAETGSESGFGGGPGSESTTTSLKDSDLIGTTGHLPQLRRVVGKQTCGTDIASAACTNSLMQHTNYSQQMDVQDSTSYLLGTVPTDATPPGLVEWRRKLHHATEIETMRECMDQLIDAIAWEKSIMKVLCQICRKDSNEAQLLLCDGCDHGYHTYCFRPPLVDIPPGDWFCYDCVSKATGRQVCFVCGGCAVKNAGSVGTTNASPETMSRLLTCEQCSRTVHPCCSRPPMTRPPRRWVCANCSSQQSPVSSRKVGKPLATSGNPEAENSTVSRSSPIGPVTKTPEIGQCNNSQEAFSQSNKNIKTNPISFKANKPSTKTHESKSGARSSNFNQRLKNPITNCGSGLVNKLKQQSKNRVRLKSVRNMEDSKFTASKRPRPRREYRRKKPPGRNNLAPTENIANSAKESSYVHSAGEDLSIDSNSHQSGRDSIGGSEYIFGQEDETPKKLLTPTELAWCRMVTKDLINHQASWAFRKPVNLKQVPFYRKIIKHPMDLSTIYKKTRQACAYSTIEEWRSDVRLIFDNCEVFNEDDSEVGRAGHTMRAYFESRWCQPSIQPSPSTSITQLVTSGIPSKQSPVDRVIQPQDPNSPSDMILARLKESVTPTDSCVDTAVVVPSVESSSSRLSNPNFHINEITNCLHASLAPVASSPAHSNYSEGRSSGFSGFDQNECMMGLQLDDLNSPVLTSIEPDLAPAQSTLCDPDSVTSTLPSDVCLPTNIVSSPL